MSRKLPKLALKRVYESVEPTDGKRVLVDRIWPRGLTKQQAQVDVWQKDVALSAALRAGSTTTQNAGRGSASDIIRSCEKIRKPSSASSTFFRKGGLHWCSRLAT